MRKADSVTVSEINDTLSTVSSPSWLSDKLFILSTAILMDLACKMLDQSQNKETSRIKLICLAEYQSLTSFIFFPLSHNKEYRKPMKFVVATLLIL